MTRGTSSKKLSYSEELPELSDSEELSDWMLLEIAILRSAVTFDFENVVCEYGLVVYCIFGKVCA